MRAVHLLRHEHAIITLCRVLNVNRSSYYKHFNSKEPKRAIENRNIKNCILQIYSEAKCRYGAQKMRRVLEVNYGIHISQGRVYRLMKQMQLPKMSTVKPKFKTATQSNDRDCHNVLKQNFNPKEPNKAWCSDITYIKAGGKFYYLCVIIDLFSRRVIAYKISCKIDTRLVLDTKGHPYDNAVAEAFFKFLKLEEASPNILCKSKIIQSNKGLKFKRALRFPLNCSVPEG